MTQSLTLYEFVTSARLRRQWVPWELSAFILLQISEAAEACSASLRSAEVVLDDQGGVYTLSKTSHRSLSADVILSLKNLLGEVLNVSGSQCPERLSQLSQQDLGSQEISLNTFRSELEACLMPLNPDAMRRTLGRMVRETLKFKGDGFMDSTTQPPQAPQDVVMKALQQLPDQVEPPVPVSDDVYHRSLVNHLLPVEAYEGATSPRTIRSRRTRLLWPLSLMILLSGAASILMQTPLARDYLSKIDSVDGHAPPSRSNKYIATQAVSPRSDMACGDLHINVSPSRAQVLLFLGKSPVVVGHLPVGVAHEFVAVVPDHAPKRAVVPSAAEWNRASGTPRYELSLNIPEVATEELRFGGSLLPENPTQGTGERGEIRLESEPKDAALYQVIGFAPRVLLKDVPLDKTIELLIVSDGFTPQKIIINGNDFSPGKGNAKRQAIVSTQLKPLL